MIGKKSAVAALLLLAVMAGQATAVSISASVDRDEVALGDAITLSITISGKGGSLPEPKLPDFSDFDVYSSGRNQSISVINGSFSSTLELNYVLVPKRVGELVISPVVVKDRGGMVATEPIKIHVRNPGQAIQRPERRTPSTATRRPKDRGDFFIEQVVDKRSPYVGEQVTLTFRFYQAVNLWEQPTLEWPEYVGFTVEDLPPNSRSYKTVNGRRYLVTEIKRALFPLSAGEIVIDSPRLTIKPEDFSFSRDPFSLFDMDFRDLRRRAQPKVLTAEAIRLKVKSLPEGGKPANFSGAVGEYRIRAETDKDSVGVDEPVVLRVTLSGTGNIRSLPQIQLPELGDFRVYDSGNTESVSNKGRLISGTKTFEQALIPKTSGKFTIPSISFSYFDPRSASYKTVSTKPIEILATGEGLSDVGGSPRNIIAGGKKSFGYIITDFPKERKPVDLAGSWWFWLFQALPLLGMVAAVIVRSHRSKLLADAGYARRISAGKKTRSAFKAAMAKKKKGDYAGFYGALYDAVAGFVADRLNLEKSGMTVDDLKTNHLIPEDVRRDLVAFLEQCQSARFAPQSFTDQGCDEVFDRASDIVLRLQKRI